MSTPEQPPAQPLTRRQLRERGLTGPVTVGTSEPAADAAPEPIVVDEHAADPERVSEPEQASDAERVSESEQAPDPEQPDDAPDERSGKKGREGKKSSGKKGAKNAPDSDDEAVAEADDAPEPETALAPPVEREVAPAAPTSEHTPGDALPGARLTRRQLREQERVRTASVPIVTPVDDGAEASTSAGAAPESPERETPPATTVMPQWEPAADPEPVDEAAPAILRPAYAAEPVEKPAAEPVVNPSFGASVLQAEARVAAAPVPPTIDDIVARSQGTATSSTPSALILSQTPEFPSLSGPLTGTGELIVTGTYHLPEGLGSTGADPLTADGKEVDAALFDRELPPASSPTPIAASAAISTVRGATDIIQPPAPEKGSRLVLTLAITAAVLAVAVIGVVVVAVTTGVFG